ncbi:hypothetical protein [Natronomonas sp.]|uniref:DUF7573 domain-containing protein n=1 Tax=Natronomonas sp. TaxID=2184060 RepID=UPI003988F5E2
MRDRSLDEFLNGDEGDSTADEEVAPDAGATEDGGVAEDGVEADDVEDAEADADAAAADSVEPAVSTHEWTPTGAECDACGAVVERRWRDDGERVCESCKVW